MPPPASLDGRRGRTQPACKYKCTVTGRVDTPTHSPPPATRHPPRPQLPETLQVPPQLSLRRGVTQPTARGNSVALAAARDPFRCGCGRGHDLLAPTFSPSLQLPYPFLVSLAQQGHLSFLLQRTRRRHARAHAHSYFSKANQHCCLIRRDADYQALQSSRPLDSRLRVRQGSRRVRGGIMKGK